MKQFFKILFASLFGAILALGIIVGLVVLISIKSIPTDTPSYADKNVLLLQNVVSVGEVTVPELPTIFSDGEISQLGLSDILRALEIASNDDKISGIVLENVTIDAGYPTVGELAAAIQKFRQKGKFVVSYNHTLSQKSYLLSSGANEIVMNSEGMAEFHGISSTSVHYKNLLEKVGLKPVVIRCGKYKSYVESVTQEKMSDENRMQKQVYIDKVWKQYGADVAKHRPILVSQLNSFADSVLICTPQQLLSFGFIDKIQYADEFWDSVKVRMGLKLDESVSTISLRGYIKSNQTKIALDTTRKSNVALILAQGSIDLGKSDEKSIGSETYCKIFKKVREDSSIKAVVFRINSGGGSALASELIWREVSLTAVKKPVIVSMGDVAASGGYYIATPATAIVASPSTLTGSIGVFGMSMTAEGLLNKIGVNVDKVNTHPHSDFGNISRDMDPVEVKAIQNMIDKTYKTFKTRVSEGRHLPLVLVEEIAQGRVWSGADAKERGLVDTLGGLDVALQMAAKTSNLGKNYGIKMYPQAPSLFDMMSSTLEAKTSVLAKLTDDKNFQSLLRTIPTKSGVYMQLPYNFTIE